MTAWYRQRYLQNKKAGPVTSVAVKEDAPEVEEELATEKAPAKQKPKPRKRATRKKSELFPEYDD